MRKFPRLLALILLFLTVSAFVSKSALAVCSGSSGTPFNCTPAIAGPTYNDLVFGGATSGAQNGQSLRWTWGQVFTGTTLTSPLIINGTIQSLNTPLAGLYGGTGVANSGETITLGGNILTAGSFTISGAHALTFTITGDTNITLPTSGTFLGNTLTNTHILVGNVSNVATDVAMSGDATMANTGAINVSKIGNKAVTLVGALTTTGGTSTLSMALGGNTSVTLPTSGTLLAVVPNYLTGGTLSNDGGTPNTVLDTAAATAADSTNAVMIVIGAFTKSVSGAWAAGSGSNGMGNGLTVAASTWYHVCLAYNNGTPDEWFDTSAVCANKPAGVSGALFRRIGSFRTDGSVHILAFSQNNDEFLWAAAVGDMSSVSVGLTAVTQALTVPTGVKVNALFNAVAVSNTAGTLTLFNSQDQTSVTTASVAGNFQLDVAVAAGAATAQLNIRTNTSAQIRVVGSSNVATNAVSVATQGWLDYRGK